MPPGIRTVNTLIEMDAMPEKGYVLNLTADISYGRSSGGNVTAIKYQGVESQGNSSVNRSFVFFNKKAQIGFDVKRDLRKRTLSVGEARPMSLLTEGKFDFKNREKRKYICGFGGIFREGAWSGESEDEYTREISLAFRSGEEDELARTVHELLQTQLGLSPEQSKLATDNLIATLDKAEPKKLREIDQVKAVTQEEIRKLGA